MPFSQAVKASDFDSVIRGFESHKGCVVGSLPNDVSVAEHLTENDNAEKGCLTGREERNDERVDIHSLSELPKEIHEILQG